MASSPDLSSAKISGPSISGGDSAGQVLQQALELSTTGIALFGPDGHLVFANRAFRDLAPAGDSLLREGETFEAFHAGLRRRGWLADPNPTMDDEIHLRFPESGQRKRIENQSLEDGSRLLVVDPMVDHDGVIASVMASEERSAVLFQKVPIGLWEEDYSGVKAVIDQLKAEGVADFAAYFRDHPERLAEAVDKMTLIDTNHAGAQIYGLADREAMIRAYDDWSVRVVGLEAYYLPQISALAEGQRQIVIEHEAAKVTGEPVSIRSMVILDPEVADTWARVISIDQDITEERRAAQAVRDSETRFKDFATVAADWYWETDADHRFISLPVQLPQDSGLPQRFHYGKRRWEIANPADIREDPEKWARHRAGMEAQQPFRDFVYWRLAADGSVLHLKASGKPVYDEKGAFIGYRGAGSDITAAVEARQAVEDSGALLADAIENLSEIFALWDAEDRLVLCNRLFREIAAPIGALGRIGERYETMLRAGVATGLFPDSAGREEDFIAQRLEQHRNPGPPLENRRQDGRWLLMREQRLSDGSTVSIGTDITEQKRAAAALRESEQQFRDLVEGSLQGVLMHQDFALVFVNQTLCDILGYDGPEELLARESMKAILAPEEIDRIVDKYQRRMRGEAMAPSYQVRCRRKDGTDVTMIYTARAARWRGRDVMQVVFMDITDRVLAEERLRQAQRMESLGQLTGGIAHDFNNLLAIVQGNAELLEEEARADPVLLDPIVRSAWRGNELTQRLLSYARRQTLEPVSLDLNGAVRGLGRLLRRTLGDMTEIELRLGEGLAPCLADPGQLENALLNLVLNARDAMPNGGVIGIETAADVVPENQAAIDGELDAGQYLKVSVEDKGAGMTPEVAHQAFDPFFTTKAMGEGSGLGLSMVYGFAKQSGGHAAIRSRPGAGSQVTIWLPRSNQPPAAAAEEPLPPVSSTTGRVLLVEDEANVRAIVERVVTGLGWQVVCAGSGLEAERILFDGQGFDLLLSDVMLPGGTSGIDLARMARREFPGMAVILMSGFPDVMDQENAKLLHDVGFLRKPFRKRDLIVALEQSTTPSL